LNLDSKFKNFSECTYYYRYNYYGIITDIIINGIITHIIIIINTT